ncbi:MAG: hypothetical protein ACFCBU_17650 [Cyanophyceae cyanobacterium]
MLRIEGAVKGLGSFRSVQGRLRKKGHVAQSLGWHDFSATEGRLTGTIFALDLRRS